jgi:cellulose 1,4-beta-cellobiosidase
MYQRALLFSALWSAARAQQAGTLQEEVHPALTWQRCEASGTCTDVSGSVVLDSNWRWTHSVEGSTNCYTGNTVSPQPPLCRTQLKHLTVGFNPLPGPRVLRYKLRS